MRPIRLSLAIRKIPRIKNVSIEQMGALLSVVKKVEEAEKTIVSIVKDVEELRGSVSGVNIQRLLDDIKSLRGELAELKASTSASVPAVVAVLSESQKDSEVSPPLETTQA